MGGFFRDFSLKNLQISQNSEHPLRKLLHSVKGLFVGIFCQMVFNVNFTRNGRKYKFCLTASFFFLIGD